MTDLRGHFDDELRRWTLRSDVVPGAAGLASVELAEGASVHADLATGLVVEVTFDSENASGRLDDPAGHALQMIDRRATTPANVTVTADVEARIGRLAVLCETLAEQAMLGPVSDWWAVEANALFGSLDLEPPAAGPGDIGGLRMLDDMEMGDASAARWRRRIDAVAARAPGVTVNGTPTLTTAAQLQVIADPNSAALGSIPLAGGGRVAPDPSLVPPGRLDLRLGLQVMVEPGGSAMTVTAPVQSGVYAAAVQDLIVMLVDEPNDVPIAVAPFTLGSIPASSRGVVARADLIMGTQRDTRSVSMQLTSVGTAIPSQRLRHRRRELAAARFQVRNARLASPPAEDFWSGGAFLGEIADAAALADSLR